MNEYYAYHMQERLHDTYFRTIRQYLQCGKLKHVNDCETIESERYEQNYSQENL